MSYLQFFKVGKIMAWAKCGHLVLPGGFPDKATLDIDFADKVVDQCDVPGEKIPYRWW